MSGATLHEIGETMALVLNEIDNATARHPDATADVVEVPVWRCLAALVEEVGEVGRALHDDEGAARVRAELLQVATVAILWAARPDEHLTPAVGP